MRARALLTRVGAAVSLTALALGVTACGDAAPSPSPSPTTAAQLCADPIVIACDEGADWLHVTLGASVTDETATLLASDAHAIGEAAGLTGGVTLEVEGPEAPQLDVEIAAPPKWTVTVYPGDADAALARLEQVIAVADVPGTTGISIASDGWPTVMVLNLSEFEWVFTTAKELPLFADGGTYTLVSTDPRLRVVHVPARMAEGAIREIIAIALAYPDAEVLLEAATTAPHNPTLYVSGLTPDEVTELDERLGDPALADADVDGYAVTYVLGAMGADGIEYTSGTLGAVPAE